VSSEASAKDELLFEKKDHVAVITLNRPDRGNAMTASMQSTLAAAWTEVRDDPRIRCAIVTGTGDKHFCTGADVQNVASRGKVSGGYGSLRQEVHVSSRQNEVWKPAICAVNGVVAGVGLHLVVDSDIVVAADSAVFMDTHVNIGMVGAIENIGLAKRLPLGTALRMTLQGRNFRLSADRAYQLGLVEEVVPLPDLMELAWSIADDICANSPNAVSLSQRAVWSAVEMPYSQAIEYGYALLKTQWGHPDFKEGPLAYVERREPRWSSDDGEAELQ
jgi:E-phenylitaconyl-CoA hydratase